MQLLGLVIRQEWTGIVEVGIMCGANIVGFGLRAEELVQTSDVEKAALERSGTHKFTFVAGIVRRLKVLLPDIKGKRESHADIHL